MPHFALSVYPEKQSLEEIENYFIQSSVLKPERVFTCLLSATEDPEVMLTPVCKLAHQYGLRVIADVSKEVFNRYGISPEDLSYFKKIGLDGIRIDDGFSGQEIAKMTFNDQDLILEVNASAKGLIEEIMANPVKKENLQASHNFYPQRYTGISRSFFEKRNEPLKRYEIPFGAFIGSLNKEAQGPWPLKEGLCTLEELRELPIEIQALILLHSQADEILISNFPVDQKEIEVLSKLTLDPELLRIKAFCSDKRIEKLSGIYGVRPDRSEFLLRLYPRINQIVEPDNCKEEIEPGDVMICNKEYSRYQGEIQIALKKMRNDGRKNIIGKVDPNYRLLLKEYLIEDINRIDLIFTL